MWVTFLTRNDLLNKDNLPQELNDPYLKKALGVLDVMNFNAEERAAYEDHLKWLRMEASALRKRELEASAEGREEGRVEEKIETAKSMLENNVDMELIAKITRLSIEEINKLKG